MTLPPVTVQDKLLTPNNPNDGEYFVKAINGIASHIDNSNKVVYKIWWDGYPTEASTWQTYEDISNIHYVLPEYHDLVQKKLQDLRQSEPNSRIVQFWSRKSIAKLWTAETSVCQMLEPERSIKGLGQDPQADESGQNQVNSLKSKYPKRTKSKTNLAEQPNKLECGVCSFSGQQNIFSNLRELKRHEKLEHKVVVNAWSKKNTGRPPPPKQVVKARVGRAEEKLTDVSAKGWECDQCRAKFQSKFNMKRHKAIAHGPPQSEKCPKCEKVLANKAAVNSHLKTTCSGQEKIKCSKCDNYSGIKTYLKRHIERCHK
ncbi:unnamed protein product [Allacma fusca]|nr:unnamed protein product [Allacma fusca]